MSNLPLKLAASLTSVSGVPAHPIVQLFIVYFLKRTELDAFK